ncbi:MAG: hypothetical protein L0331_32225 [Chloroflexi bacterium]|nr:hypothetical protein [Chloroflexota bacterium]
MAQPLIQNVTVRGNRALRGGGIYAFTGSDLKVINSVLISNTAVDQGGAAAAVDFISVANSRLENNRCISCAGGGLHAATFRVTDTVFISNTAGHGGGGYALTLADVTSSFFQGNNSLTEGGGLYAKELLTVTGTTFLSNTSGNIGGAVSALTATVANTVFQSNSSDSVAGGLASAWLSMTNTLFLSNTAELGGGLYTRADFTVANSVFIGNSAILGGAHDHDWAVSYFDGVIVNSLFTGNSGNEILYFNTRGTISIIHTTIADNTLNPGRAIFVRYGTISIVNTLITNHMTGIYNYDGLVSEDYNLFFANSTHLVGPVTSGGNSLFDADPNFVDPAGSDYHIGPGSAALDNALDLGIPNDLDGNPRRALAQTGGHMSSNPSPSGFICHLSGKLDIRPAEQFSYHNHTEVIHDAIYFGQFTQRHDSGPAQRNRQQ